MLYLSAYIQEDSRSNWKYALYSLHAAVSHRENLRVQLVFQPTLFRIQLTPQDLTALRSLKNPQA